MDHNGHVYAVVVLIVLIVIYLLCKRNPERFAANFDDPDVPYSKGYKTTSRPKHPKGTWGKIPTRGRYDGTDNPYKYPNPSVDMVDFRSKDPEATEYHKNWDYNKWGMNTYDKYIENDMFYNNGVPGAYDPNDDSDAFLNSETRTVKSIPFEVRPQWPQPGSGNYDPLLDATLGADGKPFFNPYDDGYDIISDQAMAIDGIKHGPMMVEDAEELAAGIDGPVTKYWMP